MRKLHGRCRRPCAVASSGFLLAATLAGQEPDTEVATVRDFVERQCIACHGGDDAEAGLDLQLLVAAPAAEWHFDEAEWQDVYQQVRTGAMPPAGAKRQPGPDDRLRFASALRAVVVRGGAGNGQGADPGRPLLRRLHRTAWQYSLRDLLGIAAPSTEGLPEDPSGEGFDSLGDVLFVSPLWVERYWDATVAAVDAALADDACVARLSVARPEDGGDPRQAVRTTVEVLLRRVFRRTPTDVEIDERSALLRAALESGAGFEAGLRRVLLSPHFLFRVERDRPELGAGGAWPLPGHELAVRLAYFVWSSTPDEQLLDLAESGQLQDEKVLRGELQRMLADPRSRALADDFAAQWLGFRALRDVAVDIRRYRGFSRGLRHSMYEESAQAFLAVVRENRSVFDLVDSDRTFLNATLARHYGIAGVKGDELREVALEDPRRGGVLGMASILTATSYPLRTSPVVRGKWVLENLLGAPPPPPPPDAGELPDDDQKDADRTLREQLEDHRRDARCATCHLQMDAFGLALERFDGVGKLRELAHTGEPIDDRVELPDGTALEGVTGLKRYLTSPPNRARFVRTFAERALVHALGRPLGWHDGGAVDAVVEQCLAAGGSAHALLEAVILSQPFRQRRNPLR